MLASLLCSPLLSLGRLPLMLYLSLMLYLPLMLYLSQGQNQRQRLLPNSTLC